MRSAGKNCQLRPRQSNNITRRSAAEQTQHLHDVLGAHYVRVPNHQQRRRLDRAQIVISPDYVDSPVVEHADVFVAFSQPAYTKFYDLCDGKVRTARWDRFVGAGSTICKALRAGTEDLL